MKKNIDQLIDDALKSEPNFNLGADFRDRVVKTIRKNERRSQRKLYVLISLGVLGIFGVGLGLVSYLGIQELFSGMGQLAPLAVLIGGAVVVIQYLDKKLVKDRLFKQLV